MLRYKIFRQAQDHSFVEIAQATYLEDAEAVLARWPSGLITEDNVILQSKNLKSQDTPALSTI
jgi:hypothetical protein